MLLKNAHLLKALAPAKVMQSRLHRRVFMQFAEKIGLVYFGYVDQRSDEHRLVRGLTVSARHRDNNYCIGSYDHYDITLVERSDTLHFPGKPARAHNWIILTFDFHTLKDVPHIFLGLHSHNETFYAHLLIFLDRYSLYTNPAHMVLVEQLFTPEVTKTIASSFSNLTVEVADGSVYIYAENTHPTAHLLERMLKNGLWLTQTIDQAMAHED